MGCVVVLLLALVIGVSFWGLFLRPASDVPPGQPVQIEIPQGSSTAEIGQLLADIGVVGNANRFRYEARSMGADGELRAGVYDLSTGSEYDDVIELLRRGPESVYVEVTIPEGFVIEQIAERVEAETGISASEFLALARGGVTEFPDYPFLASGYEGSLEGYLFPKTYRIKEGAGARDVIITMLEQYKKEMDSVDTTYSQQRGVSTHELVTIASMIEREAQLASERELISSVIYNRIAKGMRLEIDATIEYVLPGNRFRLTNQDLELDSPYNTYRNAGLPPGPIANPGLASLQAAARPAQTEYIYYVLTGTDGSHTFTTNYDDFQVAKQKSKEVFGR